MEVIMWVARGNISQICYIPKVEQYSLFGFMLLHLGNVTLFVPRILPSVCLVSVVALYPGLHHSSRLSVVQQQ